MANWEDRVTVKKGNYGERMVRDYLSSKGWIVYEPQTEGPHAFDKLCVKDKQHIIIAEVKTKARMNKWNATGFNKKSYDEYIFIQNKYSIDIFIFFVDEMMEQIYGNKLSVLSKGYKAEDGQYPLEIKNIILFSLDVMVKIADIANTDAEYLKSQSTRNYEYERREWQS